MEVNFVSEWPGGSVGGDYERKEEVVPEPIISEDGIYRCSQCNEGFSTRQEYVDHYVNVHGKIKVEKNYPVE